MRHSGAMAAVGVVLAFGVGVAVGWHARPGTLPRVADHRFEKLGDVGADYFVLDGSTGEVFIVTQRGPFQVGKLSEAKHQ